jgi:diguanylate cyclase (GGDEF)-like protein/PAS domain S-box-containing protein
VLGALDQLATLVTSALGRHRSELARRRSEDARRKTEDRFRRLVQSSPDLVLVLDDHGVIKYASPVGEPMLGYTPEQKVGTVAWELIHPEDLDEALAAMGDVLTGNLRGRDPARLRVRHRNDYWVPVEVTATNLLDDPVLAGVVVNVRDMRERNRIEATLREAEIRFQQAWHHAPIGMALTDAGGRMLRVNPAFCEMLGYSEPELLSYRASDITHPDDVSRSRALLSELFAGDRRSYSLEKRYRRSDGTFMWARTSVSIVRDDEGKALYSIGQVEDITERRRLQEQLAFEASHDALTGLPQRKRLLEELERALAAALRRVTRVAVLFIDVDHFKRVNDAYGHSAGDELLIEVGRRLRACVRSIDTAARFGGDEFVVVCPDLTDAADAARIAERVKDHLSRPYTVRGGEVLVGASIGIALSEPSVDASTLLGRADTAAYRAKELGRSRWEIFDDDLRESVTRRLDTELALRRALEHDELRLLYQPIVVLDTGEVRGFEALVRWDRPDRGLVAPAEFLPVAEETGLIVTLDRYVLATACAELARWQSLVPDLGTPLLSVNLSGRQLLQPELLDDVRELLTTTRAAPERLCLEFGERVLVHDPDQALRVLDGLRDLGVRVAIDDFGAGYSPLSHLRRVPLAHVKLDRSLVLDLGSDPTAALIAGSVIDLARTLGMPAVAVGVETPEHVAALRDLGCELAQGYYFSTPVAAELVPRVLDAGALPVDDLPR